MDNDNDDGDHYIYLCIHYSRLLVAENSQTLKGSYRHCISAVASLSLRWSCLFNRRSAGMFTKVMMKQRLLDIYIYIYISW